MGTSRTDNSRRLDLLGGIVELKISERAFRDLIWQRGEWYDLRHDQEKWEEEYRKDIQRTVSQFGGFAPAHMLDIGSGLGGIDVVLTRGYGTKCWLVDGKNGAGCPTRYHIPFCNAMVLREFWFDNGVEPAGYLSPDELSVNDPIYDTVISTRSWCFHYAPETYLAYVQQHTIAKAMILVDMRTDKPEWRERMRTAFEEIRVVEEGDKYQRIMYFVRGSMQ